MMVGNPEHLFVLRGTGDVIEPDEGIAAIGSGGRTRRPRRWRCCATRRSTPKRSRAKALEIAAKICIYTNDDIIVETLP